MCRREGSWRVAGYASDMATGGESIAVAVSTTTMTTTTVPVAFLRSLVFSDRGKRKIWISPLSTPRDQPRWCRRFLPIFHTRRLEKILAFYWLFFSSLFIIIMFFFYDYFFFMPSSVVVLPLGQRFSLSSPSLQQLSDNNEHTMCIILYICIYRLIIYVYCYVYLYEFNKSTFGSGANIINAVHLSQLIYYCNLCIRCSRRKTFF